MTRILGLFDLVPGWVWAILFAGATTTAGVQYVAKVAVKEAFVEYRASQSMAVAEAERNARAQEQHFHQQIERISADALKRENTIQARADSASRALDGLRRTISSANSARVPGDSACAPFADAAASARELLGSCAEEYRSVAEGAERIRNQVIALQEYATSVSTDHGTK